MIAWSKRAGKNALFKEALLGAACLIPGGMWASELNWLMSMAGKHERILEIGALYGRSTKVLAGVTPGSVTIVDSWDGEKNMPDEFDGWRHTGAELEERFRANLAGEIKISGKVQVRSATFERFCTSMWDGEPFDMIFIDASHEYEDVKADCLRAQEIIAPGGLICGHDINWREVEQAVAEVFVSYERPCGRIWIA